MALGTFQDCFICLCKSCGCSFARCACQEPVTLLTASACLSASDSWLPLDRSGLELAASLFLAEYGVGLVACESLPFEAVSAVALSAVALLVVELSVVPLSK